MHWKLDLGWERLNSANVNKKYLPTEKVLPVAALLLILKVWFGCIGIYREINFLALRDHKLNLRQYAKYCFERFSATILYGIVYNKIQN